MSHDLKTAKPGAGTPGFARSALSRLVATLHYRIGLSGANAGLPFLPVAMDGEGHCAALLWGGLQ
jgi:hypothetical protein